MVIAILPPQAIRPWNAAPVTQKHHSLTAVKKDHLRQSKNEPKAIGASHRHKRGTSHNSWESLTIFTINHYHLPNMLVKVKGCPSVEATVGKSDILLIRKTNDLNWTTACYLNCANYKQTDFTSPTSNKVTLRRIPPSEPSFLVYPYPWVIWNGWVVRGKSFSWENPLTWIETGNSPKTLSIDRLSLQLTSIMIYVDCLRPI